MNNSSGEYETLSLSAAVDVNRVCDQFEEACRSGLRPRIEDYVGDTPDPVKLALIRELIRLDLHYHENGRLKTSAGALSGRERYEFKRTHAAGGIGLVSLHRDRELGRDVALKELHPEKNDRPEFVGRFIREAQITGRLEHPGIVPVYELVRSDCDGSPFYTMRFVDGQTLTEETNAYHLKRRTGVSTPLEMLRLLNAFVSVCQTVAYAHSRGVIHRDLKGSNVVLGSYGEVIVLDWGLAKVLDSQESAAQLPFLGLDAEEAQDRTLEGHIKGTPQYIAPEAAEGSINLIGKRTDVYGLGAILYEILTGQPPFKGSTISEVLHKVKTSEPEKPSTLTDNVPPVLEAICLRALGKNIDGRQESAAELADEVRLWLAESAERSRAEQERERFFNLSVDMLCTVGFDGRFKQLNPAWERTLGWTVAELLAQPFSEFIHPDDREATLAETSRVADGIGHPGFENRYLCKDNSIRWISWTASLIPGEQLIYAVGRDVSERKKAEEALRRSQERFELAVRGSGDGIWDWDLETGESFYSPRWKSMIGFEDHELPHDIKVWEDRVHPDDKQRAIEALQAYIDGSAPVYEVEYRFRHKDGSYLWIHDRGVALSRNGRVYRIAGVHTDITERKRDASGL